MTHHHDVQYSPYTPQQIFDLVADVPNYPHFLPWCRAARILEKEDNNTFLAELVIAYKHMSERYTSRVKLCPADSEMGEHSIYVEMTQGPFHHLTNTWHLTATEEGGTKIDFILDFAFKSKILDSLLGKFFATVTGRMAEAFKKRADELYGTPQE
ncbi:MAG: type II toxin-antitoxin system RatA family toxin [Alphaproteobacteria bacterium]|nr:type II toxin-antitoxin system RatA family toxin [Alphaproteobacteria bacterium]